MDKGYLSQIDFDISRTIKDYEYTRRSVINMNRIVDAREFEDMDSEMIFQYLLGQMEIVSFKDYLKRYLYEKTKIDIPFSEVGEEIFISAIIDNFRANRAPRTFGEASKRWNATVKDWLRKESVKRDTIFLLGFGLRMSDTEVSDFLTKVLKEQDFRFRDPRETVFWHCFHRGLEYSKALELLDYYHNIPEHPETDAEFWDKIHGSIKIYLSNEEKLKEYLVYLKGFHGEAADHEFLEYQKLYDRACKASEKILRLLREEHPASEQKIAVSPADIETILCSGIPKTEKGNLINASRSGLSRQFQKKRMSRQRISNVLKRKQSVERFDIITLLFLVYAVEVEPDWPTERCMRYIDEVNEILERCDMMGIYPVNPYESFILMCLLAEEPLTVYSDIWEMSFQ